MKMNSSEFDAGYLCLLADALEECKDAISEGCGGRFAYAPEALRLVAEKVKRNGYEDDLPEADEEELLFAPPSGLLS